MNIFNPSIEYFRYIDIFNPIEITYSINTEAYNYNAIFQDVINTVKIFINLNTKGNICIFSPDRKFNDVLSNKIKELSKEYRILREYNLENYDNDKSIYLIESFSFMICPKLYNVSLVIDTLYSILPRCDLVGGASNRYEYVSLIEANGRAKIGKSCYRCLSKEHFDKMVINVNRCSNLDYKNAMYKLVNMGLDAYEIIGSNFKTEWHIFNLIYDYDENFANILNIDINYRLKMSLLLWNEMKYNIYPMLVMISILQCYNNDYFKYPLPEKGELAWEYDYTLNYRRKELIDLFAGKSDIETYYNIWTKFIKDFQGIMDITMDNNKVISWFEEHYLNSTAWMRVIYHLQYLLNITNCKETEFDPLEATNLIRPIFLTCYPDHIMEKLSETSEFINTTTKEVYITPSNQSINQQSSKIQSICALLTSTLNYPELTFNIIDIFIDI